MSKLTSTLRALSIATALSLSTGVIAADIDANADGNDLAIKGYDPVAYFTDSKAVKGKADFSATYKNAIYHFSNEKNRDEFRANPVAYAPQYGGYCAFGVAMEKKFDTDPLAWKIVDEKLYLNLDKSVQKRWLSDTSGYITTANTSWTEIKGVAVDKL